MQYGISDAIEQLQSNWQVEAFPEITYTSEIDEHLPTHFAFPTLTQIVQFLTTSDCYD